MIDRYFLGIKIPPRKGIWISKPKILQLIGPDYGIPFPFKIAKIINNFDSPKCFNFGVIHSLNYILKGFLTNQPALSNLNKSCLFHIIFIFFFPRIVHFKEVINSSKDIFLTKAISRPISNICEKKTTCFFASQNTYFHFYEWLTWIFCHIFHVISVSELW